jgi:hypothetical protein
MPLQWWQIGITIFSALLSFLSVAYWTRLSRRDRVQARLQVEADQIVEQARHDRDDIVGRLLKLETSLAVIDQKVIPISTALQAILVKELTHYHTPVLDELLTRIGPPSRLTPDEEEELVGRLFARTQDMDGLISDSERDAAFILPAIMRRAKVESVLLESMFAHSYILKFVTVENLLDK